MFLEIIMMVLATACIFLLFFSVAAIVNYLLQRHELGQEGAKRDLLRGIPGICAALGAGLILAVLLIILVPKGWTEYVDKYLAVLVPFIPIGVSAILWIPIITWPWRKKKVGTVLLDIGPFRGKLVTYSSLLFFILLGVLIVFQSFRVASNMTHIAALIILSLTILCFALMHRRLVNVRITEKGISTFLFLLKWEWITSYEWIDEKKGVLSLQFKKYFPLFRVPPRWRTFMWRIPPDRKDSVDKLLAQYITQVHL
jgi:hypothetical protein